MKLGIRNPDHLIASGDHSALAYVLRSAEDLGYDYVSVGDHVLGAETASRPDWRPYFGQVPLYDHRNVRHEVLILFGLITGMTTKIEMATGILISPQRQTALLAKQAAEIDYLSGSRLRLVLATGWNDIEYEALGVDFHRRGRILDEQIDVMRKLWTEEVVTYRGDFTTITAAGINPLPNQRPIPVWIGGASRAALRRAGRLGDGWFPSYPYFHETQIRADIDFMRTVAAEAGRDPANIGIQGMPFFRDDRFEPPEGAEMPPSGLAETVDLARRWEELGATHFTLTSTPWAGKEPEALVAAMAEFADAMRH